MQTHWNQAARSQAEREALRGELRGELERRCRARALEGYFEPDFLWALSDASARQWNRESWGASYAPLEVMPGVQQLLGRSLGDALNESDELVARAAKCLYCAWCEAAIKSRMLSTSTSTSTSAPSGAAAYAGYDYEKLDLTGLRWVLPELAKEVEAHADGQASRDARGAVEAGDRRAGRCRRLRTDDRQRLALDPEGHRQGGQTRARSRAPRHGRCRQLRRVRARGLHGRESELLFPSTTGGFRAPAVLNKPFSEVAEAMELGYAFTQRGMRRTFNDLARHARIESIVTRSISGHLTERMQDHYSTVDGAEQRSSIARVIELFAAQAAEQAGGAPGGAPAEGGGAPRTKAG